MYRAPCNVFRVAVVYRVHRVRVSLEACVYVFRVLRVRGFVKLPILGGVLIT